MNLKKINLQLLLVRKKPKQNQSLITGRSAVCKKEDELNKTLCACFKKKEGDLFTNYELLLKNQKLTFRYNFKNDHSNVQNFKFKTF